MPNALTKTTGLSLGLLLNKTKIGCGYEMSTIFGSSQLLVKLHYAAC